MATSFTTIAVPKEYGYVVAATAGTFFLGLWHAMRVPAFRRPAQMAYPQAYADSYDLHTADPEMKKKLYLFNCAQRAHANYLENQPSVAVALLVAGLAFPVASAVMGALWLVFRTMYMIGYTRTDKDRGQGRLIGSGFWFCQFGLYGLTAWMGIKMLL